MPAVSPVLLVPTRTMRPSGSEGQVTHTIVPPRSTTTRPPLPKVVSGCPFGWNRITSMSDFPLGGVVFPAATILPFGCMATAPKASPPPALMVSVPSSEKAGSGMPAGSRRARVAVSRPPILVVPRQHDPAVRLHGDRRHGRAAAHVESQVPVGGGAEGGIEAAARVEQTRHREVIPVPAPHRSGPRRRCARRVGRRRRGPRRSRRHHWPSGSSPATTRRRRRMTDRAVPCSAGARRLFPNRRGGRGL